MTWLEISLIAAIAILIIVPPNFDPAIKLHEFNEAWAKRLRREK